MNGMNPPPAAFAVDDVRMPGRADHAACARRFAIDLKSTVDAVVAGGWTLVQEGDEATWTRYGAELRHRAEDNGDGTCDVSTSTDDRNGCVALVLRSVDRRPFLPDPSDRTAAVVAAAALLGTVLEAAGRTKYDESLRQSSARRKAIAEMDLVPDGPSCRIVVTMPTPFSAARLTTTKRSWRRGHEISSDGLTSACFVDLSELSPDSTDPTLAADGSIVTIMADGLRIDLGPMDPIARLRLAGEGLTADALTRNPEGF